MIRHSIKRLRTPVKGESKHELRMTVGRGKSAKKRTLRFDSKEDAKSFVEAEESRLHDEKKKSAEMRALGISDSTNRTWDSELAYYYAHAMPGHSPAWASTIKGFETELTPFLKGRSVYSEITHEAIDEIVAYLRKPRPLVKDGKQIRMRRPDSLKTLWLKVAWIQSVLNYAVKKRRLKFSPIADYEKSKVPEPEIEYWERGEAESFLKFADQKYPLSTERRFLFVAYLTKMNAALRAGELFAMRPRGLKRETSQYYVVEQFDKVAKTFRTLKGKRVRMAPLNLDVLSEIEDLIRFHRLKSDDLLFSINGHALDHKNFYAQFQRDVAAWGGKRISVHGLRHTGATLMLIAGVDLRTLQKILGHSDVKQTERYAHVVNEQITKAAQSFSVGIGRR